MLKILGLLSALLIVIATLGVGTWAYFNDVTTITGNAISAGTLYITTTGTTTPLAITDIKPINVTGTLAASATNAFDFDITNGGTLSGTLDIAVSAITNNENTRNTVETNSGDTTSAANAGELGGKLKIAVWMDVDKDGTWSTGDYYLSSAGSKVAYASGTVPPDAAFDTVDSFGSKTYTTVATLAGSADAGKLRVEYVFPSSTSKYAATNLYTDNVAQSDGVAFDLTITLTQN
ncbi:MAG: TasA family protein [Dehalococcoidales bacterium]|nr:TasA family protein [Dehalococcoidales bacterium]